MVFGRTMTYFQGSGIATMGEWESGETGYVNVVMLNTFMYGLDTEYRGFDNCSSC